MRKLKKPVVASCRLTDAESAKLRSHCDRLGCNQAQLLRDLVLQELYEAATNG